MTLRKTKFHLQALKVVMEYINIYVYALIKNPCVLSKIQIEMTMD